MGPVDRAPIDAPVSLRRMDSLRRKSPALSNLHNS